MKISLREILLTTTPLAISFTNRATIYACRYAPRVHTEKSTDVIQRAFYAAGRSCVQE